MNKNKKRILVVDDEKSITRLIKLNLEQTDEYEVCEENLPTHALTAARQFCPDLILLDVVMPDLGGDELAGRFRDMPLWNHVPIVFLTAAATKEDVRLHGGKIGGETMLAKPVTKCELLACLDKELAA